MMQNRLIRWFSGSLRRQLVVGMVLVITLITSLFVWEMARRQHNVVFSQRSDHAVALARSVATSSSVWVISRDYSGLQEIVEGLKRYPDLQFAIILDKKGQILAHTDASRVGLYMNDLPQKPEHSFIGDDKYTIDVATPIMLSGTHIGWVRIGLGQQLMAERMARITRSSLYYSLFAILIAAILATLAARRLTHRIYAIKSVADAVQAGHTEMRVKISGMDEAAQLARQFNTMLDTLAKRETEIVTSHNALQHSESRLKQIMAITGEGIWDWDLPGNRIRHNARWYAILGLKEEQTEHPLDFFSELVHEDDRKQVMAQLQACLTDKEQQYRSEHRMYRADGQLIWVQDRGDVTERDTDGKPVRMLGSISDISARKLAEQKLKQLNEELEQRVEQRTRDLQAAKDEAERANRAKSDFLSSMSHELRTPMNAILGFSQLLQFDEHLSNDQQDSVHEINKAGAHLLELINEILDLSRVESGLIELSLEPVELQAIVDECMNLIDILAEKRKIQITHGNLQDIVLRADRTRLKQILLNLLSNAVKYNREGGSVHLEMKAQGADRLQILVIDTGPGIAAESLHELFQPFSRLDAESRGIEGTGIGLNLSRSIVESMGGSIGVQSEVGVGSTFWIELPLDTLPGYLEHITDDDPVNSAPPKQQALHTVLYIGENPTNLRLMTQIPGGRNDIRLLTAHTPGLGLELARAHHPELILLDIDMPGMDGYQALNTIKADATLKHIPAIAVTADALSHITERNVADGFADYITKPIELTRLMSILDRFFLGEEYSN